MGHGGNVIAELTADHREFDDMFRKIQALPEGDPGRRELADRVTVELVRHSVAEETYLFPAVRRHLPDGDALADAEIGDHANVEKLLKLLEGLDAGAPAFEATLTVLIDEVTDHIASEEAHLFPALAGACSPAGLDELGERIRRAKERAPTRPHPAAPDTPPVNKLLAPGIGLVDKARDALTGRGR